MRNEDAFQDSEGNSRDREHQSKRTGTPEIFVVEQVPDGGQVPGIVTSDRIDKDNTKGANVGLEGEIRGECAVFSIVEALHFHLSPPRRRPRKEISEFSW